MQIDLGDSYSTFNWKLLIEAFSHLTDIKIH